MFTKGQPVTLLQNWDRKGTVRVVDLIVYSCGKKQMVLVDDNGANFAGQNFRPTMAQDDFCRIVARLTPDAADAAALALGAVIVLAERERMEQAIAHYGHDETHHYNKAMREDIAALHEPRVLRRS